jgi:hypothetical protein
MTKTEFKKKVSDLRFRLKYNTKMFSAKVIDKIEYEKRLTEGINRIKDLQERLRG